MTAALLTHTTCSCNVQHLVLSSIWCRLPMSSTKVCLGPYGSYANIYNRSCTSDTTQSKPSSKPVEATALQASTRQCRPARRSSSSTCTLSIVSALWAGRWPDPIGDGYGKRVHVPGCQALRVKHVATWKLGHVSSSSRIINSAAKSSLCCTALQSQLLAQRQVRASWDCAQLGFQRQRCPPW